MGFKTLFAFLFSLVLSEAATAGCLLNEVMKDAKLADNAAFWEDYGKLAGKGKVSDRELQDLAKKHGGLSKASSAAAAPATFEKSLEVTTHPKAKKEIEGLDKHIKEKYSKFLEIASKPGGINQLRTEGAGWRFERVVQWGDNAYTVRLNQGIRVLFDVVGDNITIRRVNAAQIHGN